jgi:hypothetical protein
MIATIGKAEDHWIVFTDGNALYRADSYNPGTKIVLATQLASQKINFGHPFVNGKYLWYDKTETSGSHGQRLFYSKWMGGYTTQQTTRDPYGSSNDEMPIVSAFHTGTFYQSNRTGSSRLSYSSSGRVGPGYGLALSADGYACWGLTKENKDIGYSAINGYNGIHIYIRTPQNHGVVPSPVPYSADKSLYISANRLSMSYDSRFVVSSYSGAYYLVPGQEAKLLSQLGDAKEAFVNPEGTKILYTTYEYTGSYYDGTYQVMYRIFSADINENGEVLGIQEVVNGVSSNPYFSCWPTWCPESMFFELTSTSVKLNFAKTNSDYISFSGSVLVPKDIKFTSARVFLDGVTDISSLNTNNSSVFKISERAAGSAKLGKWSITYPKCVFAEALANYGLTNPMVKTKLSINMTFVFSSDTVDPSTGEIPPADCFNRTVNLSYTYYKNKTGTAILTK